MVEQRDIDIILNNPIDWELFRNKTVLVTGATGRLGMYIVEAINKADIDWNLNVTILALARNEKKMQDVFGESLKLPNIHPIVHTLQNQSAGMDRFIISFIQQVPQVHRILQTGRLIHCGGTYREPETCWNSPERRKLKRYYMCRQ